MSLTPSGFEARSAPPRLLAAAQKQGSGAHDDLYRYYGEAGQGISAGN